MHSPGVTAAELRPEPRTIFDREVRASSIGILVLVTLIAFEAMAVNAALPTAARELHGLRSYGWAFTGFLIASVVGMVLSGQLADRRGPGVPLVVGLVSFTAGLLVGGTASTMAQLVAGRVVQGLGGGLIITAVYVVIGQAYRDELRPSLFSALSSAWVVPGLIGPPLAGAAAEHLTWRLVFLALAPLVVLGGLLLGPALRTLHHPDRATSPAMDGGRIGRAVVVAGGVAVVATAGQHPSWLLGSVAVAALCAVGWGLRPLLPPGTFTARPGVAAPVALRGLFAGAFFAMESVVPLSLTVQHQYGPTAAGLPLTVTGITWFLGSWWQGRRVAHDGTARRIRLIRVGFTLVALAAGGMAVAVLPGSPGWVVYLLWGLGGLGAGMTMSSIGVVLLRFTSDATRGRDSAALQLSDSTAAALTTAVVGTLLAAAARGAVSQTAGFVAVFVIMGAVAVLGAVGASRARPADPADAVAWVGKPRPLTASH